MNIVLVGIQGSGKGTQARLMQEEFGYHFFEMGQKLRNFTTLGLPESSDVGACINSGKLVPIKLTIKIISHYLETHSDKPVIFDGIPRSPDQKEKFDEVVGDYFVIFLDLKKEDAIKRLSGRRIDPITGESFSSDFIGEINPGTGNKLVTRDDDKKDAVERRVEIFFENTLPLLAMWGETGKKIYKVDASRSIEEVFVEVKNIISRNL